MSSPIRPKQSSNRATNFFMALTFAASSSAFSAFAAEVDNSEINKRDTHSRSVVPSDQAKGSELDVEVTRQIRAEIVKDSSLSVNAQNVKIITLNGIVTLRGPVASVTEKNRIESLAKTVTANSKPQAAYKIKNEIQITQ